MIALLFLGAVLFLALGHLCKAMRWRRFVGIYENTPLPVLISSLAAGYLINFYVPFHLGDLARVWLAGRKMENRYGYAASTIIVDRCLDVLASGAVFFRHGPVRSLCGVKAGGAVFSAAFGAAYGAVGGRAGLQPGL